MVPEILQQERDDKANVFQRTMFAFTLNGQYPEGNR